MTNKIFDEIQRTDDSPMRNRESEFEFYNRSSRPAMEAVRGIMESCISNFPDSEIEELTARIRCGDDIPFRSASFELFLHEAMIRLGFELQIHPELTNGNTYRPDFLVKDQDGHEFYLEAVLAKEINELDDGAEARKGLVYDALSVSPHENFMIDIDDEGSPITQPSGKKLTKAIHYWLNSLDPDDIKKDIDLNGLESIEPFEWGHEDWSLKIRPIPLKPERRGKSTNLIGCGGTGGGFMDAWSPIKGAIRTKGGKYGELDKPLLIAVNLNCFHLDRIDEMQALYGQEQYVFSPGHHDQGRIQRAPNGAWYGHSGPQYTRVSGAWIFNDLHPSSLAGRNQTIYFNPWATNNLPYSVKSFPHAIPENDKMEWVEGVSFMDTFDLHRGWPE